jgi:hypothetical protein
MRRISMVLTLYFLAALRLDAWPVDPKVYCAVDLTYNNWGTLTSRASASYSDNWGNNPAPATLTGQHDISGSNGSSPAMASVSSSNGTWAGTLSAGITAPDTGQVCYQGNIYVSSGDASQGAGSNSICFAAPPPPPPPSGELTTSCSSCDPLVLDLNGDGIHTTETSDPVWFDVDGDGIKEHITWTNRSTTEGFLYLDLNHKNRVDNGRELFGVGTVMADGSRAKDGFEALAMYDQPAYGGNGDGVIDANDGVWNHLRVWVDSNHNGVCEPNETGPIHAYGVAQIQLGAGRTNLKDPAGNTHVLQGLYMRHVNAEGRSFDTHFAIDSIAFQLVP